MVSVTSGTTSFTLDVDELIEHALLPLGGDYTNAVEQQNIRRALNLVLISLQNKNIPLNKIDTISVSLIEDQAAYSLPDSVSDVLSATLKNTSSGIETMINREGAKVYHNIPNKAQSGTPTTFTTERNTNLVVLKLWPVPSSSTAHTLELLVVKKIEDITAAYQKIDLPIRYYPLLVKWLAYEWSLSRQGIGEEVKNRLKMEVAELGVDVFDEDRERSDFYIVPGGISGR